MAWLESAVRFQRKAFRMAYRLNRQVNIQIRPIQVVGARSQDVKDLLNCGCLEPRKLGIRKYKLLIVNKHPDEMAGNIGDYSS
jgi:hypothetical protein